MTFGKTLRGADDLTPEEVAQMIEVAKKDKRRAEACERVFESMLRLTEAIAAYEAETGEVGVQKLIKKVRKEITP